MRPSLDQRRAARLFGFGLIALVVACVVSLILILGHLKDPVGAPAAVSPIPTTAVWYAGKGGGSWLELLEASESGRDFHVRVFADYTGQLELDSWFSLSANCEEMKISKEEFHKRVRGYDGTVIYLTMPDGRQDCRMEKAFPTQGIAGTRVYYEIEGKRVSADIFNQRKQDLEISDIFSEGEMVKAGRTKKDAHKRGYVHMRDAKDKKTGKKFQYAISTLENQTIYSISSVRRKGRGKN